ncbi:SIMPL domain-containing protein [Sneathiella chinensis]|uniref:SIMPL domain-containing protein n=1 Tax=Sneathiella chinensis TaxID=349750 RepID=A0ABQ5U091_9PROT|nr:SIMPL domain-containing protein [Sneathiella chinensis]GLQ05279.1 hypothetical protein GCM10007924_05000 [Sneathiella chinensis]
MKKLIVTIFAVLAFAPAAYADMNGHPGHGHPGMGHQDRVVLNLKTQGWVTTETARVHVNFDITQQKETAAELKQQIMAALDGLAGKAQWYITSSNENKDRTGLTRWMVSAEARVGEEHVSGLADRAEKASRPGFKVNVGYVDFSPSQAEFEALRGELRETIYTNAVMEAERLNRVFKDRTYKVSMVDFLERQAMPGAPAPRVMHSMKMAESDAVMSSGGSASNGATELAVSRRVNMSATVILTAQDKKEN